MKDLRWPFALVILLFALSTMCSADSVSFIQALGIGATSEFHPYFFGSSSVSVGGLTVTAWAFQNNSWQLSELTARNDVGSGVSKMDHGLGVCSAPIVGTGADRTCGSGPELPGYLNELDNINNFELLQISRTDGTKGSWNGINVSSLDMNTPPGQQAPPNPYVSGQVFYSDFGLTVGGTALPTAFANLLCTFNYDVTSPFPNLPKGCVQHPSSPGEFDASIVFMNGTSVGPVDSQYLYVWANNPSSASGPPFADPPFNDFLLQGVTFNETIPEPASLLLMASGLGVMSWVTRRKSRG